MNLKGLMACQALATKAQEAKLLQKRDNTSQEPTEQTQIDLMQGSDKEAVLCSPPQSPYGLHWTPLDSIWTLPKKWPSLDWSPVQSSLSPVQSTFFSLKLSLKSNDIYIILQYFLS